MADAGNRGWTPWLMVVLILVVLLGACTQTSEYSGASPTNPPNGSPPMVTRQMTTVLPSQSIPGSMAPICGNVTCAVRAYFDTVYPIQKGDNYSILIDTKAAPLLGEQIPDAELIQAYAMFRMPAETATFIFFSGRAYAMPDEFNTFIRDSGVEVRSERDALDLADLYVMAWEPHGSYGIPPAMVISSPGDIPQRRRALPPEIASRIGPPDVIVKESGWEVHLFAWSMAGGTTREWNLTIARNGTILESRNDPVGNLVGDYLATSW